MKTAAGIICSKLAIVFPPFIANDSTNWLSNWSFGVCPPLIDYEYLWIRMRARPVRYCACSKCVCVSWDHFPLAATGTQLVCPSPQYDCFLSQPVHVWKITLSSSRNNSFLGKNVLAFYKASLCSAVRSMLRAGRRTFPTYQGCKVVVELSLWNTTGKMSLGGSEPDVLKFVSPDDSTLISLRILRRLETR